MLSGCLGFDLQKSLSISQIIWDVGQQGGKIYIRKGGGLTFFAMHNVLRPSAAYKLRNL